MSFTKINISKARPRRPNVCGQRVKGLCKQENLAQQLYLFTCMLSGSAKYLCVHAFTHVAHSG